MIENFKITAACYSEKTDARTMLKSTFSHDSMIVISISSIILMFRLVLSYFYVLPSLKIIFKGENPKEFYYALTYAILSLVIMFMLVAAIVLISKLCWVWSIFGGPIHKNQITKMISLETSRKTALLLCILANCIDSFIMGSLTYLGLQRSGNHLQSESRMISVAIIIKMALGILFLFLTVGTYMNSKEVILAIESLSGEYENGESMLH